MGFSTWVDGSIDRYKAKLVAKDFDLEDGIDYTETFSPIIKTTTIWVILALVMHFYWSIWQLDVSNAFCAHRKWDHWVGLGLTLADNLFVWWAWASYTGLFSTLRPNEVTFLSYPAWTAPPSLLFVSHPLSLSLSLYLASFSQPSTTPPRPCVPLIYSSNFVEWLWLFSGLVPQAVQCYHL